MLATFDRMEDAAETVSTIIAEKIIPCTLEFLDRMTVRCVEDYAAIGLPTDCEALLLMETDGHPAAVDDPGDTWGAGENCTIVNAGGQYEPRLVNLGAGVVPIGPSLLQDGPWCPDAAHSFRFDADLLRIRRVRVHVRLQAARPFRGFPGAWFANGGAAGDPWRFVPDERVTLEVMPRNVHVAR